MKTFLYAVMCYLTGIHLAGAQILYSGGTYTQNFNSLSQDTNTGFLDFSDPWTDNTTLTGWYSTQTTYTTEPGPLGLTLGIGVTNNLTSMGSGSDRALGSYLGLLSLGENVTNGVRIENNLGTPMTRFTLSFDLESSASGLGGIVALDILDAFALSYSSTASDVSGPGATGYQLINGNSNLLGINLLGSGSDTRRLEITIAGLNIAQGDDLWIRWDRSGLVGVVDNTLAIDNIDFSAIPEPGTYALLGLGLGALVVLKRFSFSPRKTFPKDGPLAILLVGLSLLPCLQAETEAPLNAMEETVVHSSVPDKNETAAPDKKAPKGSAVTHEYKPQWNRMMLAKDFENTYRAEIEKGEIVVIEPPHYFRSVRNYHVSNGNNSTPPPSVWLRHESYLLRGSPGQNTGAKTTAKPELPIARPNTLMPVLDASSLFGTAPLSQDEYFNKMFYLRGELMETTEKINRWLKFWDSGSISSQDLASLQSASKVEWLVCCLLIPESKEISDLLDSLYRQTDVRLNPGAMTPSMALGSGL